MADTEKSTNKEREERILDAAARLIVHYGYDKTTVSDIAEEAAVSKGAIYLHYASKDELFEALLWREIMRYSETWLSSVEPDPRGGTLAGIYRSSLYAINNNPFMKAIFTQDQRVLGSYLRKKDTIFKQRTGMRTDFIRMMQQVGAIRQDIKPEIVAHIMNMLAFGLVSSGDMLEADDIPQLDETIEGIGQVLDWALTPPEATETTSQTVKDLIRQMLNSLRAEINNSQTDSISAE